MPSAPLGASASACSMSFCLRLRTSLWALSSSAKNALRFCSIVGGAALGALFEQGDLAVEFNVLAFEVGQGLFRGGVRILSDGALARRFAHVNRAGFVYATPWLLICRS